MHVNKEHKKIKCPHCTRRFKQEEHLQQHISKKHKKSNNIIKIKKTKKTSPKKKQTSNKKDTEKNFGIFEKNPFKEKILFWFTRKMGKTKQIIMDENVGPDQKVIDVLKDRYSVVPLPVSLISQFDKDIIIACKEKKWGLVSKDYGMVTAARRVGINPVYFLRDRNGSWNLFRISKFNEKTLNLEEYE